MATLVLQAAGAAIGGLFGPIGAIVGGAVGAMAGYAVDQTLFGRDIEGPRLGDLSVQRSEEGTPIPRVYGRSRLAGQVIWATHFQEVKEEEGGKGGPTVTTYSYFANFAVGICEGPIARIGRVWADGNLINLADVHHRIHLGREDQGADSLIEAKQGATGTPAYRGTATVVFERLPVGDYGNRLPQLAFEVFRPVGGVEDEIRAVVIIPGASEFAYDPLPVYTSKGPGRRVTVNRHVDGARTDWEASIDDLQALCPNLERAALAVSWFGDDLRAGHCTVAPRVEDFSTVTSPTSWRVAGLNRSAARAVSRIDDRPAFGGTPSDDSVIRAIRDLKARGLAVTFYPFLMMDIPAGNALPHPYWDANQPAYPWRGEITGAIAPGRPGTPDKTAAAASEIAQFVGTTARTDFSVSGGAVHYSGPAEWTYRRMVLHAAHLCKAAGGVDAFLIGSELRGLTTLRSGPSTYPFVAALKALAADVRAILPSAKITYAADWSEYFGHQPGDGSGDAHFHLDPLWADAAIDAIGIDSYVPLSDWRDGYDHLDAQTAESGRDVDYLRANIAGGEGFDWYYASDADRRAQIRSPITDGGAGKPWVFRYKDLVGWWSNPHFDRPGGVEGGTPTSWVPQSKPIWFTEIGCPAIDKGANEPNVFPDPKVGGSRLPHFSNGGRDALMQERFLTAVLGYWDPAAPDFLASANPLSPVYGGRMVDPRRTYVWSWDARPYPAFPRLTEIWSDGGNWETGHWLNGRLGNLSTIRLVERILRDYRFLDFRIGDLEGAVDGFVIARIGSARQALQGLSEALGFEAAESGAVVRFVRRGLPRLTLHPADLVEEGEQPLIAIRRAQETELPAELAFGFIDGASDYRDRVVASRRLEAAGERQAALSTGIVTDDGLAVALADQRLQEIWDGRETVSLALTDRRLGIEPADVVSLLRPEGRVSFRVTKVEDGLARRIEGRTVDPFGSPAAAGNGSGAPPEWSVDPGPPDVVVLDLPSLTGNEPIAARIALFADPWPGPFGISIGSPAVGFPLRQIVPQRAVMGTIAATVPRGPVGRWDRTTMMEVALPVGALASLPDEAVLNGRNIAAVGHEATGFEVIQFRSAELVGDGLWRVSGLLRGQGGTSDLAALGHASGARFIRINSATPLLDLDPSEIGLVRTLRAGPLAITYDPERFTTLDFAVQGRWWLPFAPVHLRGDRDSAGNVHLAWIRQTRVDGDGWDQPEVPLGEAVEAYRVEIREGATLRGSFDTAVPQLSLSAATLAGLLSAPGVDFTARVRQLSATAGPGIATEIVVHG
ncbi:baseplate multidomain protein megatron [Kaistia granuli]|uniref:baseplate multidomain protein megatron n=1 Tax=Kaistia granuli TaxID=363259 RepID=UPI000365E30C|nr:glycoside hydrolase/phage tail family protein [Kaistia granuli]